MLLDIFKNNKEKKENKPPYKIVEKETNNTKDAIDNKNDNEKRLEKFINFYNIEDMGEKIVLYKAVNSHFRSKYDNKFQYTVGEYASEKIDPNPKIACSNGIHAGTLEYAMDFANSEKYLLKNTFSINGIKNYSDILFEKNEKLIEKLNGDIILKLIVEKKDILVPINSDGKVRCSKVFVDSILNNDTEVKIFDHKVKLSVPNDFYENPIINFSIVFDNIYIADTISYGYSIGTSFTTRYSDYKFNSSIKFDDIKEVSKEKIAEKIKKVIVDLHEKYNIIKEVDGSEMNIYDI